MSLLLSYFIVFCCGLSLLVAASQLVLRRREPRNWLIAALFASLCSYMLRLWFFLDKGGDIVPAFTLFFLPGIYTIGPLLYLNYRVLVQGEEGTLAGAWRHFAVPALLIVMESVSIMARPIDARGHVAQFIFSGGVDLMIWAVRAGFFGAGLYTLAYQFLIIIDTVRLMRIRKMDAVQRVFMVILSSSFVCTAIFMTGLVTLQRDFLKAGFMVTGALIISAYLLGQRYPEFMQDLRIDLRRRRYERTLLGGIDLGAMHRRLIELMEDEKIYADPGATLAVVAGRLSVTPHQLSEFLNVRLKMNFNTFMNKYRVGEARELLAGDTDLSVLQIAYSVGFNSKSAFNAAFHKFTGTTPQEYRKTGLPGTFRSDSD